MATGAGRRAGRDGAGRLSAMHLRDATRAEWRALCSVDDLVADSGVCALAGDRQVALFWLPDTAQGIHALDNYDPIGRAQVLSRGIVGDIDGRPVVASPLYKQHFRLEDGQCVEDPQLRVPVYPARIEDGLVLVSL